MDCYDDYSVSGIRPLRQRRIPARHQLERLLAWMAGGRLWRTFLGRVRQTPDFVEAGLFDRVEQTAIGV